MKKFYFLSIFLIVIFANPVLAIEKDPNQLLQEAPNQFYYPDKDAVVWKDEQVFDYTKKPYQIYQYQAIKIFNQQGAKDYSQVEINYHQRWHKLNITTALIIKPSGELITIGEEEITEKNTQYTPNNNLYQSNQQKIINFSEIEPGSILIYAYQKELKELLIPNEIQFSTTTDSHESQIVLKLPKDKAINTKVKPKDSLNSAVVNNQGQIRKYTWSGYQTKGKLLVSTLESWSEFSTWYNNLITKEEKLNVQLKKKVKDLTAGLNTKRAKIKALYNYVAENIRYLDFELGVNGYKPLTANEIYQHKYAVAKDKVHLLIALLEEINVAAETILINRQGNFDREVVVADFNHMLLYLPEQNLYLNPNSGFVRYGNLPLGDQGKKVLNLARGQIQKTPIRPKKYNQEQVRSVIDLKDNGRAQINLTVKAKGFYDFIAKALFGELSTLGQRRAASNILNKHYTEPQLDRIKINGVSDLNKLSKLSFGFEVKDYYQFQEDTALLQVNQLPISFLLSIADVRNTLPCKISREIIINIPLKYNKIVLPEDKKYINSEGQLMVDYQQKEDQVLINFNYQFNRLAGEENLSWVYINDLFNKYQKIKEQQILLK